MQSQKSAICAFSRNGNYCLYSSSSSFPFKSCLPGTLLSGQRKIINEYSVLLTFFFQTQHSSSLLPLPLCQREGNGWTLHAGLAQLGSSSSEMHLHCLGEWLVVMCACQLSKMLVFQEFDSGIDSSQVPTLLRYQGRKDALLLSAPQREWLLYQSEQAPISC